MCCRGVYSGSGTISSINHHVTSTPTIYRWGKMHTRGTPTISSCAQMGSQTQSDPPAPAHHTRKALAKHPESMEPLVRAHERKQPLDLH
eukprot:1971484-Prymnesium_polylepis.1